MVLQDFVFVGTEGNCSSENPFGEKDRSYIYRLMSCEKRCLQRAVVQHCHCKDVTLPGADSPHYSDVPFCASMQVVPDNCSEVIWPGCLEKFFEVNLCPQLVFAYVYIQT